MKAVSKHRWNGENYLPLFTQSCTFTKSPDLFLKIGPSHLDLIPDWLREIFSDCSTGGWASVP
jgi:hypothetical protein